MGIGQRIVQARKAKGLSRRQLSERAGVPYPTLAGIENGDQGSSTQLPELAAALEVNVHWLKTGKGPRDIGGVRDDPEWSDVRGYSQGAALGDGVEATDYADAHNLKFRAQSLARKGLNAPDLAVIYGRGDSMLPRIRDGDAILFDTSDTRPADEALFVIQAIGVNKSEYSVKRCRHFGDDVFFDSLNPEGDHQWRKPRRMDDRKHPITILGRVRWIGSWED